MVNGRQMKLIGKNNIFKTAKDFVLDILFPVECISCGKEKEWICCDCEKNIELSVHIDRGEYLDKIVTFYSYKEKILKQAIHLFKYQFIEELGAPLSNLFTKGVKQAFNSGDRKTVIVPIPLYRKKYLERGFNQVEILASRIGEIFSLEIKRDLLKKAKHTAPQARLDRKQRKENIKGVFRVNNKTELHKRVILIDDVFTTGATMEECARVLKEAGIREVWGLALARG